MKRTIILSLVLVVGVFTPLRAQQSPANSIIFRNYDLDFRRPRSITITENRVDVNLNLPSIYQGTWTISGDRLSLDLSHLGFGIWEYTIGGDLSEGLIDADGNYWYRVTHERFSWWAPDRQREFARGSSDSSMQIVLNDVLKIRQNGNLIENLGANSYLLSNRNNRAFDILLPNYNNRPILIHASTDENIRNILSSHALPIHREEIFPSGYGIAAPPDPEGQVLCVFGSNVPAFHYMSEERVSIDTATGMTRIHFTDINFIDTRTQNTVFMIIYVDYNSNDLIEDNEIMDLTIRFR